MTTDHRQHLTGESPPQQRRLLLHTQARSFCIALFLCLHLLSQFFPLVAEPMLPAAFPASSSSRCFFCVACLEMAPNGKILRRSLGVLKQQYLKRKAVIREERTKLVGMMETIKEKEAALDEMIAERSPSFTSGSSLFGSSSDSERDGENAAAKSVKPKGPNPTPPPPEVAASVPVKPKSPTPSPPKGGKDPTPTPPKAAALTSVKPKVPPVPLSPGVKSSPTKATEPPPKPKTTNREGFCTQGPKCSTAHGPPKQRRSALLCFPTGHEKWCAACDQLRRGFLKSSKTPETGL